MHSNINPKKLKHVSESSGETAQNKKWKRKIGSKIADAVIIFVFVFTVPSLDRAEVQQPSLHSAEIASVPWPAHNFGGWISYFSDFPRIIGKS